MNYRQQLKSAEQIQTAAEELVKRHREHFDGWMTRQVTSACGQDRNQQNFDGNFGLNQDISYSGRQRYRRA